MPATEQSVAEFMADNVVTVKRADRLVDAIRQMDLKCLAAMPVVDDSGTICGIITHSDLVGLTYELQSDVAVLPQVSGSIRQTLADALADKHDSLRVSDAMTHDVVVISPDSNLRAAAQLMVSNAIHHVPVVDDSRKPVGIISSFDIVRYQALHG